MISIYKSSSPMPSNALFSTHSLPVLNATLENFSCNFLNEKNS